MARTLATKPVGGKAARHNTAMSLADRLTALHCRIAAAALAAGREASVVRLLAVSKTLPAERLREAYAAGQRAFGESYVQEALAKQLALGDLAIEWHHIGPVQSNKTAALAAHFDWVQGVDRLKIAERLSAQRPAGLPALNICIQVNISGEESKSGCVPEQVPLLAESIAALPALRLRGLMAIPAPARPGENLHLPFRQLASLFAALCQAGHALDTLSMGMSDDFETAIAEGSTLVRLGSALFGVQRFRSHRAEPLD